MTEDIYQDKKNEIVFKIEKSIRYHCSRKRFFIYLHNWTTFLATISGTATFAAVLAQTPQAIQLILASMTAIFSMADLIISSPAKAREYDDIARRFFALEKRMLQLKGTDLNDLTQIEIDILDIESDEPPILRTLNAICHNEAIQALGLNQNAMVPVGCFQRICRHIWDLRPEKI